MLSSATVNILKQNKIWNVSGKKHKRIAKEKFRAKKYINENKNLVAGPNRRMEMKKE
jgi:hypothetical protein